MQFPGTFKGNINCSLIVPFNESKEKKMKWLQRRLGQNPLLFHGWYFIML